MSVDPETSRWRSAENYAYLEQLTASDIAWEWLRRNDAYAADFVSISSMSDEVPEAQLEKFRQRWGLRFPGRPAHLVT